MKWVNEDKIEIPGSTVSLNSEESGSEWISTQKNRLFFSECSSR